MHTSKFVFISHIMYLCENLINLKNMNKKKLLIAAVFCLGVCNYCFAGPHEVSSSYIVTNPNMEHGAYQITLLENGNIIDTCKAIK